MIYSTSRSSETTANKRKMMMDLILKMTMDLILKMMMDLILKMMMDLILKMVNFLHPFSEEEKGEVDLKNQKEEVDLKNRIKVGK